MTTPATLEALKSQFGELATSEFRGDTRLVLSAAQLPDVMGWLKNNRGFDLLVDVTCVDYLIFRDATDRYGLVYLLANTITAERITVRVYVNDPNPTVPSMTMYWQGANWLERECYDMFGVEFAGHPDHRRILMPEEFTAFPLRKDYPMQGRGERHNFPVLERSDA